ncbi:hypothetical protein PR202_ga05481 [Eleusine coracana subsp. coracana]|uniref:non-specific serine/threonine protein kinase n=1 Tax=Eleusine coracana subsp. coracana TaxID=191504 RepID=A0AAV5BTR4_ELECO|nr:hypothetical protein PR202_ga05028 [Eleusine coracana subsp. coracana]GJM89303.1 hypothetical protein PR202_ga05481 [Eleusine coracana subsp. coracana]
MAKFGGALCAAAILAVLLPCLDVALGQDTDPSEVNALRAIKGNLIDPMNNLKNWNRGDPCRSNWTGVFCHEVNNDAFLHVTELQLFKKDLSGTLAPEVSLLSQLKTLLLNGNQLSGVLPDEIGNLQNLDRLQIDQNQISGSIPKSFANLRSVKHLHMNNNSLSGQIPAELSRLPILLHLLIDNNNLSGPLPPEFAAAPALKILYADNNNFSGSSIPTTYNNISTLLKLDLGWNQLTGSIPTNKLASNITTIDLSHNMLNGTIPLNFSGLPNLQILDFQNNSLKTIPAAFDPPANVTVMHVLASWEITLSDVFGPYELLNFTLGSYADELPTAASVGLSKVVLGSILAGTIAGAIALSVVATTLILKRRSRYKTVSKSKRSLSRFSVKIDGVRCFTFEEMATATNNFDLSAQVGQGGYGKVYKGILADGAVVAIKRAHEDSLQGSREFCTEIELLSRLHHRNLVSLVGYCDEEDEQMLVYEFMPNGTLRDHLSDSKFIAKVADFGLSRLAPVPDVEGTLPAHVSTVVKGTPGYLDPEYFLTHKLTDKSDVYSLGVVFLEMLTGMKPIEHGKNIVREVNSACQSGNISEIIDNRMGLYPSECVRRFLSLATKCCQDETDARPSMWEIVRELETILRMMPEEDLVLLETPDTDSTDVSKSLTVSGSGTLFRLVTNLR